MPQQSKDLAIADSLLLAKHVGKLCRVQRDAGSESVTGAGGAPTPDPGPRAGDSFASGFFSFFALFSPSPPKTWFGVVSWFGFVLLVLVRKWWKKEEEGRGDVRQGHARVLHATVTGQLEAADGATSR